MLLTQLGILLERLMIIGILIPIMMGRIVQINIHIVKPDQILIRITIDLILITDQILILIPIVLNLKYMKMKITQKINKCIFGIMIKDAFMINLF